MLTSESYFSRHLDGAFWDSQTESTRDAALVMAENDLSALLPANFPRNDLFVKAQCEQAVYLLHTREERESGKVVSSQSVSGISRSFSSMLSSGEDRGISPAAMRYVRQLRGMISRSAYFVR